PQLTHLPSFPTRRSSDLSTIVPKPRSAMRSVAGQRVLPVSASTQNGLPAADRPYNLPSFSTGVQNWATASVFVHKSLAVNLSPSDRKSTRLNCSHDQSSY